MPFVLDNNKIDAVCEYIKDNTANDASITVAIFIKDYTFKSPSAAAAVVLGRSSNGRKEWVLLDGRSLDQTGN